ncbi:MAG TPA: hypothetical protein PKD85_17060, partial [Saprospiraceae bacterium]|nr:hypothetical protein [Saprospiraceae bacterium]
PSIQPVIEFMTSQSLATTGSAILAVVVISNTVSHVSGWQSRWFSLFLSIVVSFTIYKLGIKEDQNSVLIDLLLIIINGCLIYTSAFGLQNNVISQVPAKGPTGGNTPSLMTPSSEAKRVTFFSKW